jgi:hypothetical protein
LRYAYLARNAASHVLNIVVGCEGWAAVIEGSLLLPAQAWIQHCEANADAEAAQLKGADDQTFCQEGLGNGVAGRMQQQ